VRVCERMCGLLTESGRAVKVILGPHFKLFGNVSCANDRYVMLLLFLQLLLLLLRLICGYSSSWLPSWVVVWVFWVVLIF